MKELVNKNKWWLLTAAWVYTFTFVFDHYWSEYASYQTVAERTSARIKKHLEEFYGYVSDTANVNSLLTFQPEGHVVNEDGAYYYLYEDSPEGMKIRSWSYSNTVLPPVSIPYRDTVRAIELANGYYIFASHKLPDSRLTAVQLILVEQNYFVQTANLRTEFFDAPNLDDHLTINLQQSNKRQYAITGLSDKPLFYLQPKSNNPIEVFNWASLCVQIVATLILLIFLYRVGMGLARKRKLLQAFGWIISTAFLLRLCIGLLKFPLNLSHTILFNPVTNPSFFFPTLGGLLLNLLLLVWIVYFMYRTRYDWLPLFQHQSLKRRQATSITAVVLLLPVSYFLCRQIIQLVMQPEISFDVSNFFSLGWNTASAIVSLYFVCVLHYRLLYLCNELFSHQWPRQQFYKYIITAVAGLVLLSIFIHNIQGQVLVFVLLWLLITIFLEDVLPRLFFFGMERSVRFVFWLIWYAIASTLLVQSQQQQKELGYKLQIAKNLETHENAAMEKLIHTASRSLAVNRLISHPELVEDSISNGYIRKQIESQFNFGFSNFFTGVYLYDTSGNGLYNRDATTFENLNVAVEQQSKTLTSLGDNIYLNETGYDKFRYIVKKPLQQDSILLGTLFITVTPNNFSTLDMLPELFKPLQHDIQTSALYKYAVYHDGVLQSASPNFSFATQLPAGFRLQGNYEIRREGKNEVLWYNASGRKLIAVVKSGSVFTEAITVFAYVFSCFVLLYLVEQLLARLLSGSFRGYSLRLPQLSIRRKIMYTVILVSTTSFVLIGIVTMYFFIHRYQQSNDARLAQLVATVENDLKQLTNVDNLFNQPSANGSAPDYRRNSGTVNNLAQLLNTGINLFDLQGNLVATSTAVAYDGGVISTKMNPEAYYQMAYNRQAQFLQTETIGQLTYQGIYLPFRLENGATQGFINIPYFASQEELNQEISNFLVTLINLIAFISIIAGILAFFITNSITTSFYIIGQKMKAINLGSNNEPIQWERNDEIGVLVQQYNKMLEQLDESARKLASNEREYAWREMAKQVAHEIKNPLTPMKLNLQYLQRQIESDSPNVKQMAAKTATALVTQIDHLSQIASDFSQLARINVSRVERFDLNTELQQVVMLHQMDSHMDIHWQKPVENIFVEADRTQINRLFTNLIKNAGEAVTEEQAIIHVQQTSENGQVTVAITDNGPGIPAEMQNQLFVPNFTTKSSGTGLGLAICKDITERAGGAIWFQSQAGGPTTFYVQLPVSES